MARSALNTAVGGTEPIEDEEDLGPTERLSDDDVVALLRTEIAQASSYQNSSISQNRIEAMHFYMADPYGDEQDERSKVVTTEVRDAVESILPQLVKLFMSTDKVVRFEPTGKEDEEGADQATDYINYIMNVDNDGFMLLYTFFKDALLQKNGIVKIHWDDTPKVTEETYRGLLDIELMALLNDEEVQPTALTTRQEMLPPQQGQAPAQMAPPGPPQPGQPPIPPQAPPNPLGGPLEPTTVFDVTIRRTKKMGKARVVPVPPEEFLISTRAASIQKARYTGHKTLMTISDLISMGCDKDLVWDMAGEASDGDTDGERTARFASDGAISTDSESVQQALRQVWVVESYYLVDTDGDGIAERWKFLTAGSGHDLLKKERWDGPWPFESITPIPMSHKFFGLSIYDLLKDIQRIKSVITRQFLDNLYQINSNRIVAQNGMVNLDDLLTNRPGGIIRTDGPPNGVLMPLQPQSIGNIVVPALEYLDTVSEKRSGVTAYNQGLDANSLNKTATGISAIMNASQERILLIARIFAETGVKGIFKQLLRLVVQNQDKPRTIKLRGKWVEMNPNRWNDEMEVSVDVALGTNNRQETLGMLNQLLLIQKEALMQGLPIVTLDNVYATLGKMVENAGLKSVETYFTDPGQNPAAQQPKPPAPHEVQAETDKAKAAADVQKTQAQLASSDHQAKIAAENDLKKTVMNLAAKKLDIESKERMNRQNVTTDLVTTLMKVGQAAQAADQQTNQIAGVDRAGKPVNPRPSSVKVVRNEITREIESIIPVYDDMDKQLGKDTP